MGKFNVVHDENGLLEIERCKSTFSYAFQIGTVMNGRELVLDQNCCYSFEHNQKALQKIVEHSEEFIECLHDATDAVSNILTENQCEEINENRRELAWLLIGLGEMSQIVSENKSIIEYTLRAKNNPATSNK